jgi:16S rRNA (uracil1498-N3)-methyltransferase
MHRFFVSPDTLRSGTVALQGLLARQIALVLRLLPGERILLLDDSGWECEVVLDEVRKDQASGTVTCRRLATAEPRTKVTVYQGLLKGERFEYALQKCTEVGAVGFVPLVTDRTVVGTLSESDGQRVKRWRRIIVEAAEQANRGRLPVLHPAALFQTACETATGLSLIAWEGEPERGLRSFLRQTFAPGAGDSPRRERPFAVNLFIGPEGGFTAAEVKLARRYGITAVSLGPRILRAETAAVVVTAAILHEAGDLGG